MQLGKAVLQRILHMGRCPARTIATQTGDLFENRRAEIGKIAITEKAAKLHIASHLLIGPTDLMFVLKIGHITQATDDDLYVVLVGTGNG